MNAASEGKRVRLPRNGRRATAAAAQFLFGGAAYCGLEVAFRGYTHPSMFVVGGLCFIALCLLAQTRVILPLCAVLGGLAITMIELAAGAALNLRLGLGVWDYSRQPFNLWGQVCLKFSLLWCLLSAVVIACARAVQGRYAGFPGRLRRTGRQSRIG